MSFFFPPAKKKEEKVDGRVNNNKKLNQSKKLTAMHRINPPVAAGREKLGTIVTVVSSAIKAICFFFKLLLFLWFRRSSTMRGECRFFSLSLPLFLSLSLLARICSSVEIEKKGKRKRKPRMGAPFLPACSFFSALFLSREERQACRTHLLGRKSPSVAPHSDRDEEKKQGRRSKTLFCLSFVVVDFSSLLVRRRRRRQCFISCRLRRPCLSLACFLFLSRSGVGSAAP